MAYESNLGTNGNSIIVSHTITGTGLIDQIGFGVSELFSSTPSHNPHLLYVGFPINQFLLTWDYEEPSGSINVTNIILIELSSTNSLGRNITINNGLQKNLIRNSNPYLSYRFVLSLFFQNFWFIKKNCSSRTGAIFVAYQADSGTNETSNIVGVALDGQTFSVRANITFLNEVVSYYYATNPNVGYNPVKGDFLVAWNQILVSSGNSSGAASLPTQMYGLSPGGIAVVVVFSLLIAIATVVTVFAIILQNRHKRLHGGPAFGRFENEDKEMEEKTNTGSENTNN